MPAVIRIQEFNVTIDDGEFVTESDPLRKHLEMWRDKVINLEDSPDPAGDFDHWLAVELDRIHPGVRFVSFEPEEAPADIVQ